MPDAYDYISLMCRLKAAQTRNKELESGEHYIKLKELHQKECRTYERKIQALLTEIADAHKETIRVRNYWFQVLENMLLEFEAIQKKLNRSSGRWRNVLFLLRDKEMMHWRKQKNSALSFMKPPPSWKKNRERI